MAKYFAFSKYFAFLYFFASKYFESWYQKSKIFCPAAGKISKNFDFFAFCCKIFCFSFLLLGFAPPKSKIFCFFCTGSKEFAPCGSCGSKIFCFFAQSKKQKDFAMEKAKKDIFPAGDQKQKSKKILLFLPQPFASKD